MKQSNLMSQESRKRKCGRKQFGFLEQNAHICCHFLNRKPPEAMCKVGNRNYNEGETYTEGGLTCTCSEGSWKCPTK